jgi:hypothetical protein
MNHPRKQPNWIVGRTGYWQATSGEVKQFFGLKINDAWPDEGMPKRVIQGFICWIEPMQYEAIAFGQLRPVRRVRAKMFCGICGDEQPIGRQQQHNKVHEEERKQDAAQHRYDTTPATEE